MLTAVYEFLALIPISGWIGAIIVGLLTLFYEYLTWNFDYWQKQGVPCDQPWPLLGTLYNPFKIPQDIQDMRQYKKYGKIFGVYEGRNPMLFVSDPELLKRIMVKDFHLFQGRRSFDFPSKENVLRNFISVMSGDKWRHHRNIITPTFTTGKMKQMLILIEDCAEKLVNYSRKYCEEGKPIEFLKCFQSYSLDVIATCAFGTKIDCLDNPDSEFVKNANNGFTNPPKWAIIIFAFPKLAKFISVMPQTTIDYFTNLIKRVLDARKQGDNTRKDFLHIMLEAKAESDKGMLSTANGESPNTKYPLTIDHIVANSLLFIVAGFETTATTLSFTMYNIALNDDIQEKVIKEVDEVLAQNQGKLNYEIISEMQYIEMVIMETLRMYPPAARLERTVSEDCEINGIKVKKNSLIGIPIYSMHYDEEYFPNPEKYDPERFTPENRSRRNPYTYLPFGYGPRNCLGMRFAIMEIKIALAYMFKEFRVKICPTTDIPFIRNSSPIFLKPERMNLVLEKRTDC